MDELSEAPQAAPAEVHASAGTWLPSTVKPALAVAASTADQPAAVPVPQRPLPAQAVRSARARSPKVWCALIAFLLLAICYGYSRFSLLRESPYEGWDEINTYNNAAVITDPVKLSGGIMLMAHSILPKWYWRDGTTIPSTL